MSIEERLAKGRGGVVVKDDRKNAQNAFDNKSQVLAAREMPNAALFARISDILTKKNAEVSPGLRRIRTEHVSFAR
jgi:hypothetical protein